MTSKDDDTLPLSGLLQELTPDVTVDEDFIPTSQPQSIGSPRVSKNSDVSFNKSSRDLSGHAASISRIDDTLPRDALIDPSILENSKTGDFIPETDPKTIKASYVNEDVSCKKKLALFDAFEIKVNPLSDTDISRVPESPVLDSQNLIIFKDLPTERVPSSIETIRRNEDSVTEIVNDSAETVDLVATPIIAKKLGNVEKAEISCSFYKEGCEDTQVFDNSSVLLLDQPGPSSMELGNSERVSEEVEKSYLRETVDDNKENSQDRANAFDLECRHALVTDEFSRMSTSVKQETASAAKLYQNETQPKLQGSTESYSSSVAVRKMEFKLNVSCLISFNTVTNKILQKAILKVKETVRPKVRATNIEQPSYDTSEKSKRHSTSSSGSVYSDKTGLPFGLPKRLSTVSDQTDSSEEDFSIFLKIGKRKHERTPWSNEYLFPLAMDDIVQAAVENENFLKRPFKSSPRKPKSKNCYGVKQLKDILESSLSSLCESPIGEHTRANNDDESAKSVENLLLCIENITKEKVKGIAENKTDPNIENESGRLGEKEKQGALSKENQEPKKQTLELSGVEEKPPSVSLSDGLPVFARWTDKRYYSGVLSGSVKNDRWDVKFDDGTAKMVREDLIMPADWLKVGALVFALVDEKYESGKIMDMKQGYGKGVEYFVELDTKKKTISSKISDLCLTDVMAGIVREKYKPLNETSRGRADIDFDNVLSGKRLREQRTPLKPPVTVRSESSVLKKKSSKAGKEGMASLQPVKKTSPNKGCELKIGALKTYKGHLVEDRVTSADSPSGNETIETLLRKDTKDLKGKAKPKSLSYETEETRTRKEKNWLAPDGTPIPGPSGLKHKREKTKLKTYESGKSLLEKIEPVGTRFKNSPAKTPQTCEKSKRKRKLDESTEDSVQKKSLKDVDRGMKTRSRKN